MARRETIGIFGGTFNPIHIGHLRAAEEIREILPLDRVIFVPSYNPPLKNESLIPFDHRFIMVQEAIKGNPRFVVSDIEARIPGKSYTILTIRALRKAYPGARFFLIMGTDAFLDLPRWYRPEEILDAASHTVVILRPPIDLTSLGKSPFLKNVAKKRFQEILKKGKMVFSAPSGKGKMTFLMTTALEVSATEIRRRLRSGKSVKYLLPQKVESYIISHRLYSRRTERSQNPQQS